MFSAGRTSRRIAVKRLKEAETAGASRLLADCPKAAIHLRSAGRPGRWVDTRIEVDDFLTFMASAMQRLAITDAAEAIADEILGLAERKGIERG